MNTDSVVAESHIKRLVLRAARALDRCEWDTLSVIFAATARIVDRGSTEPVAAWIDRERRRLHSCDVSVHLVSNLIVTLDSSQDSATCESVCLAISRGDQESRGLVEARRTYRVSDQFVLLDGIWRIASRRCEDGLTSEAVLAEPPGRVDALGSAGVRGPGDPSTAMFSAWSERST